MAAPPHGYRNLPPCDPPSGFYEKLASPEAHQEFNLHPRTFRQRFVNAYWLFRDIGIGRWESLRGAWKVARAK